MTRQDKIFEAALQILESAPYMLVSSAVEKATELVDLLYHRDYFATDEASEVDSEEPTTPVLKSYSSHSESSLDMLLSEVQRIATQDTTYKYENLQRLHPEYKFKLHKPSFRTILSKAFKVRNIRTINDLFCLGRANFATTRLVGAKCMKYLDAAIYNLCNVSKW